MADHLSNKPSHATGYALCALQLHKNTDDDDDDDTWAVDACLHVQTTTSSRRYRSLPKKDVRLDSAVNGLMAKSFVCTYMERQLTVLWLGQIGRA